MSVRERIIKGKLFLSFDDGKTWKRSMGDEDLSEEAGKKPEEGNDEPDEGDDEKSLEQIGKDIVAELDRFNTISEEGNKKMKSLDGGEDEEDGSQEGKMLRGSQVKLWDTKDGKGIYMPKKKAVLAGEYLKSLLLFTKHQDPREYVKMLKYSEKLETVNAGTAAEGGNLIPAVLYDVIIDLVIDQSIMRPNATVIDMTGMKTNQLNITQLAGRPHATWNNEAAQKGTSSVEWGQISLTPYNLAVIVPVTLDIIDTAPINILQYVGNLMAESIILEEDNKFFVGNGTGQPTGIDNYTFPGRKTFSAGGALAWPHLNSAYRRLSSRYRKNGIWAGSELTLETIDNFRDTTNAPILKLEGPADMEREVIKRRPVFEVNHFGDNKMFFFDPKQYYIGYTRGLTIDMSKETVIRNQSMFERNMVAIRAEERVDGELVTTQAGVEITNLRT